MISIKGLSKAAVLVALHNGTRPLGLGFLQARDSVSEADAETQLARGTYVDYFCGRPIKVDLSGDELEEYLYDRDAGKGAAARIIDGLRAKAEVAA